MARFMIEIQHSAERVGCIRSLEAILKYGAHLITQADFGCTDGAHTGWFVVDVDSREEALRLVPPPFRSDARIVELRKWTKQEIEAMVAGLKGQ